jgi:hypothetical protein
MLSMRSRLACSEVESQSFTCVKIASLATAIAVSSHLDLNMTAQVSPLIPPFLAHSGWRILEKT